MLETEETTQQNVIEYALGVELTTKEVSNRYHLRIFQQLPHQTLG